MQETSDQPDGDEHRPADPRYRALRRWARVLPAAFLVLGTVIEILRPGLTISALFAAAPIAAAALQTMRATVITGIVSCVTISLLAAFFDHDVEGFERELPALAVVAVSLLAVGINYLIRRNGEQLASARIVAEAAQLAVLPAPPARVGGLIVAARYKAAQTDASIGGDFYAVQHTPHGVRLIVGDVRGKGLGAVSAVVIVIGAFREAAEEEPTLAGVAARLDRSLEREGQRRLGIQQFEGFTTAVLAELPPVAEGAASRTLRLINRGHPPPLLLDHGAVRSLDPRVPALPLGVTELGVWPDRADEFAFPAGAQLLLYTDGLSEARDEEGTFYDPVRRLSDHPFEDPEAVLDMLMGDVEAHTGGGTSDDMALLAVGRPERAGRTPSRAASRARE
ncbi:PP2C family protein-serine/threonine phosphatase [Streptomyces sp. NPDC048172]|uniref:PP2C family protein-serine/threonine phosphatase n=1 Tax=Streptomyces sp. NPDC048172 TaxID=3365505 RepID=UPI0037119F99